jgi:hypothetical protein
MASVVVLWCKTADDHGLPPVLECERHSDSVAMPVWHAERVSLLILGSSERMTRLKGAEVLG